MSNVRMSALACVSLACLTATSAQAQTAPTNPPVVHHWDSVAAASVALTRGNSRSFLAAATVDTKGKYNFDEFLLGASAGYGDTTTHTSTGDVTTTTANYYKGYGQWNHLFTERFYAGIRLDGVHDAVADIHYRLTANPLAGYYLIKETNTDFSVEAGPSFVTEHIGDHYHSYVGERVAERFEHKFGTGAKIWEHVEWVSQATEFDNWFIDAEAGVSAPITKALDVRLVVDDTYNNRPAGYGTSNARLKNDLKLLAGIGYRF